MITPKRLIDVYDDVLSDGGLFSILNLMDVPWKDDINATTLDDEYFYNISGQKTISPLVRRVLNNASKLSSDNKTTLANIIYKMNALNWEKEYETLFYEYNPISNYDMEERETPAETTHTMSPAETTETITPPETTETITPPETTETITPPETTETIKPAKTTTENTISAFNSSGYVEDNKSVVTGDNNDKGTNTLDIDTAGTSKIETDTAGTTKHETDTAGTTKHETDTAGTDIFTVQNERVLTRAGNIGVMSSQKLVEEQRTLWLWNYIYTIVFPSIDKVLTVHTYHR